MPIYQAPARDARFIINEVLRVGDLGDLPGIAFMPEAPWGRATRWLTVITVDPAQFGATSEEIRLALEAENIESRPLWKPSACRRNRTENSAASSNWNCSRRAMKPAWPSGVTLPATPTID